VFRIDLSWWGDIADGRGLRYDARRGQYVFRWQTSSAWAGTCRQFILAFTDGSIERLIASAG
jgi:hypothetical protein